MASKLEHTPGAIKYIADGGVGLSVVLTWITTVTPILNFAVVVLAILWGVFRLYDMQLSIKIKNKKLAHYENKPSEK